MSAGRKLGVARAQQLILKLRQRHGDEAALQILEQIDALVRLNRKAAES